jgi:hypothetical protein
MLAVPPGVTTLPPVLAQAVSAVALTLLAASGVSKLIDPDPTVGAMRAARIPSSRLIARTLAGVEIAAAALGLGWGGLWLVAALTLYLGFAVFTLVAVQHRLPIQSCGCFGRDDTPPTWGHVVFNGLSAMGLGYLIAVNRAPVPWYEPVGEIVLYSAFGIIGAYLAYLLLAQLPRIFERPGQ